MEKKFPIMNEILDRYKYKTILPIQQKFIEYYKNRNELGNLVVSAETSSGKTIVAEVFIEQLILTIKNSFIIYIVPLKSLLEEKYAEFSIYLSPSIKIIKTHREYEKQRPNLLLITPELLFLLIKDQSGLILSSSLVICDEIHLISSQHRGITLDVCITFLKTILDRCYFLLMSASIPYADKLANWIKGDVIEDDERVIKLNYQINISTDRTTDIMNLIRESHANSKSLIIFRRTKPDAYHFAKRVFKENIFDSLSNDLITELEDNLFSKVLPKSQNDSEVEEWLKKGVGFHTADVRKPHRNACEFAFKSRELRIIICTPTLGMGVNLPADIVVISEPRLGESDLTPTEFHQFTGRAGRLGYSDQGEGILFVSNENDRNFWQNVADKKIPLDYPVNLENMQDDKVEIYFLQLINTNFFESIDKLIELNNYLISTYVNSPSTANSVKIPDIFKGLRRKLKTKTNFNDKLKMIGEIFFEKELIKEEDNLLQLTELGEIVLKLELRANQATELLNEFEKCKNQQLSIIQLIINMIRILNLSARPIPGTSIEIYGSETINAFADEGFNVESYPEFHGKRGFPTTNATSCALIFRWIGEEKEENIINTFSIWGNSFIYTRNRLSEILDEFASWYFRAQNEFDIFINMKLFYNQIYYGLNNEKAGYAIIPNIGRITAIKIADSLSNDVISKNFNFEEIEELFKENKIQKRQYDKVIEILKKLNKINPTSKEFIETYYKIIKENNSTKIVNEKVIIQSENKVDAIINLRTEINNIFNHLLNFEIFSSHDQAQMTIRKEPESLENFQHLLIALSTYIETLNVGDLKTTVINKKITETKNKTRIKSFNGEELVIDSQKLDGSLNLLETVLKMFDESTGIHLNKMRVIKSLRNNFPVHKKNKRSIINDLKIFNIDYPIKEKEYNSAWIKILEGYLEELKLLFEFLKDFQ